MKNILIPSKDSRFSVFSKKEVCLAINKDLLSLIIYAQLTSTLRGNY